jgi:lipoprotein-releasing system permease protein
LLLTSYNRYCLNLPFFIARRIASNRKASFSRFIIRLATVATALSVAIMIISVAVVYGFKETIKDKMFVFWGHIQIAPFSPSPDASFITPEPFKYSDKLLKQIKSEPEVTEVHPFALKAAILNTGETMQGIRLKGVGTDYNWKSNEAITFEGKIPDFADSGYAHQIVVSQTIMDKLDRKIGDTVQVFFIDPQQDFPRVRKLQICGTYHTGMDEIDNTFSFCDIRLLRRISNWTDDDINGYQVSVKDYRQSDTVANHIYQKYLEPPMNRTTMQELYPNIFNWLGLMNTNAYIILAIMAIVAVINMSTALLIFIMERTNMIGTLKALGMTSGSMQQVFLYHAANVALKGIAAGTLLGVGFCLLQNHTHFITINESAYYMQYAPVKLVAWHVILIDLGTMAFCTLIMLLPALMVKSINIVKALRFK